MTEKDPDILVNLTTARDSFEGDVIVRSLEAVGIPAHAFSTSARMLQWEVAMTDPIKIQVRRADLPLARQVLAENAEAARDGSIDWDAVDVGEAEEVPSAASAAGFGSVVTLITLLGALAVALGALLIALLV